MVGVSILIMCMLEFQYSTEYQTYDHNTPDQVLFEILNI
jgi:hypothetical protein